MQVAARSLLKLQKEINISAPKQSDPNLKNAGVKPRTRAIMCRLHHIISRLHTVHRADHCWC